MSRFMAFLRWLWFGDEIELTRRLPPLAVPSVYRAYHDRLFRMNRDRYKDGLTGCWVLDEDGHMVLVGKSRFDAS